jgi:hypothetical protein
VSTNIFHSLGHNEQISSCLRLKHLYPQAIVFLHTRPTTMEE